MTNINRQQLRLFYRERNIFIYITAAIGFVILDYLWLALKVGWRFDPTPLHYNIFIGIDRLGSGLRLWLFPLIGLGLSVVNFALAYVILPRDKYLAYYLSVMAGIANAVILIFLVALTVYNI